MASFRPLPMPMQLEPLPVATVDISRDRAHEILGPPHLVAWEDGMGDCDYWAFEYACGLKLLHCYLHDRYGVGIHADLPELSHIVRHLPFPADSVTVLNQDFIRTHSERMVRFYPQRQAEFAALHAFQVWRVDDNGNVFKVGEPTSERAARCWAKELEAHGHKQMYWCERVS